MSRDVSPLDTTIEIVTPENIAFQYRLAGPFRRLNAFLIDLALRGLVLLLVLFSQIPLVQIFGEALGAFLLVIWFFMEWFYLGIFETYFNGQTPGKRLMGIRTLTLDGQPINGLQAVLRNILRSVDSMPWLSLEVVGGPPMYFIPTYVLALISMAMNPRFQRLGDFVCGTMVVVEERRWFRGVAKMEDPRAIQLAALLPADLQPSRTMARAVAAYVERRRFFSPARRHEIAHSLGRQLVTRCGLPEETSDDLLLCAFYYRTFVTDSSRGGTG
jgi:uncharacterized RDD family membrane protein YckC